MFSHSHNETETSTLLFYANLIQLRPPITFSEIPEANTNNIPLTNLSIYGNDLWVLIYTFSNLDRITVSFDKLNNTDLILQLHGYI